MVTSKSVEKLSTGIFGRRLRKKFLSICYRLYLNTPFVFGLKQAEKVPLLGRVGGGQADPDLVEVAGEKFVVCKLNFVGPDVLAKLHHEPTRVFALVQHVLVPEKRIMNNCFKYGNDRVRQAHLNKKILEF